MMEHHRDERADSFLLMSSIWPTIIICLGYVYFIKVAGPRSVSTLQDSILNIFQCLPSLTTTLLICQVYERQATLRVKIFCSWLQSLPDLPQFLGIHRGMEVRIINICYDYRRVQWPLMIRRRTKIKKLQIIKILDFSLPETTAGSASQWIIPRILRLSELWILPGFFISQKWLTWSTLSYFCWRKSPAICRFSTFSITAWCPSIAGGGPGRPR